MSEPRRPDPLLTTTEVAKLLQLHPKQVYRLVREGLPGRRVGGEWRFLRREVIEWVERGGSNRGAAPPAPPAATVAIGPLDAPAASATAGLPPLVAANGDLAIERLLGLVNSARPVIGFVPADRERAIRLLEEGAVLAAGSHGKGPPARLGEIRLARIHLVRREIGLLAPRARKVPALTALPRLRFASRPSSAGVVAHLERAVSEARLTMEQVLSHARPMDSHRDVACAVLRGDADVGLATRAWASITGLAFRALAEESYGLLVRASDLGDPRVVRLCEAAQGPSYRALLEVIPGYDATDAGLIHYDAEPQKRE